jgi:hypothetical protein
LSFGGFGGFDARTFRGLAFTGACGFGGIFNMRFKF